MHGKAIVDLDDEQELIQIQQDTRSTSLCTSYMSDVENESEVWHRIQCMPTTFKFNSPCIIESVTPHNTVCIETSLDFRIPLQII